MAYKKVEYIIKNYMARPSKKNPTGAQTKPKFTTETIDKLKQAFAIDCTVEEACFYADIDISTFYVWRKQEPKLFKKIELLRQTPILAARKKVAEGVKESYGNAMDYLKRKRKDEFAERTESTGKDGTPLFDFGAEAKKRLAKYK